MVRARRLNDADLDALCGLDAASFALPWPRQQFADEVQHTDALVLGLFDDGERMIAALCARHVFDELWIFRIMSHPDHRRRGAAHTLLNYAEAFAQSFDPVRDLWLEVSDQNPGAIAFYEREGFSVQNRRKAYYPIEPGQSTAADALVMKKTLTPWRLDYELLDFGEGFKLERFGSKVLMRPDTVAQGRPRTPLAAWRYDAVCSAQGARGYTWQQASEFASPFEIARGPLRFELRLSQSKNIGLFPEQEPHWVWLAKQLWHARKPLRILNLFAYTGAASLVCAQSLADVCHLDSAKSTVRWASDNARRSALSSASLRWIVDDAAAFVNKELKRGHRYDGIILDPPPMGHGAGKRFEFQKDALDLLRACRQLLSSEQALFLMNAYAMNLEPEDLGPLVSPIMEMPLEVGELGIKEAFGDRRLSCNVYARSVVKTR
jgi:23S rRNA (cytosine1962-C5)-methyltransferase